MFCFFSFKAELTTLYIDESPTILITLLFKIFKMASEEKSLHFIEQIIEDSLASGFPQDQLRFRFPPEPNGYLHIGHAKSICLNFGLGLKYNAPVNLRFDDTNPAKEEQEYVDAIKEDLKWLGFNWTEELYSSDYFQQLYDWAVLMIKNGKAYVDSQTSEDMAAQKGTPTQPGVDGPYRNRSVDENLSLFEAMKNGDFPEGTHVLRAKIDMASTNMLMRDPLMYRILHRHHHRTANEWKIYPMYDYAHGESDYLEQISHSICTLEFVMHRELYNWFLDQIYDANKVRPNQYEFARLNLNYTVMSKRKLLQLVQENFVDGWDDPRMPTIAGIRRRGYTPKSIRLFCERIGVSKADSWIDMSVLEQALRDDLDARAPRATAVLKPLKLIIQNYPNDQKEPCSAPRHPQQPELGKREFHFGRELWIEADDFQITPPKGFFRLYPPKESNPGGRVRLRHGFVIECTGMKLDQNGQVVEVYATYFPDSKSGTPDSNNYKVKGNIHWIRVEEAVPVEVRLYDHLFTDPHPDSGDKNFLDFINPRSKNIIQAFVEPCMASTKAEEQFQFERHGYFVADRVDSKPGHLVFNQSVGLKDSWK